MLTTTDWPILPASPRRFSSRSYEASNVPVLTASIISYWGTENPLSPRLHRASEVQETPETRTFARFSRVCAGELPLPRHPSRNGAWRIASPRAPIPPLPPRHQPHTDSRHLLQYVTAREMNRVLRQLSCDREVLPGHLHAGRCKPPELHLARPFPLGPGPNTQRPFLVGPS